MKKTIVALFALPLIFVGCGKQKIDPSLYGTWRGETTSSTADSLKALLAGDTNNQATNEIVIYRIDSDGLEVYKTKDNGTSSNQVQIEIGKCKTDKNVITFDIAQHSCTEVEKYPLHQKIPYKVSDDMKTLSVLINLKTVVLTKLDEVEANGLQQALTTYTTGCYSNKDGTPGAFKAHPVEKPHSGETAVDTTLAQAIDAQ
jgi:hypothetical protein